MLTSTPIDNLPVPPNVGGVDVRELQGELETVGQQLLAAFAAGFSVGEAVSHPDYPELNQFHRSLRDALFLELDRDLGAWASELLDAKQGARARRQIDAFHSRLIGTARADEDATHEIAANWIGAEGEGLNAAWNHDEAAADQAHADEDQVRAAIAKLLVFESLRLKLYLLAYGSEDFTRAGGEESDLDMIADQEIEALLEVRALTHDDVRPMAVLEASAYLSLAALTQERAAALRSVGQELRDELHLQARLGTALRSLRLPESVLLENAFSSMLGHDRVELPELQAQHPLALGTMSRQAMDQRVSRGRKALTQGRESWPTRRAPALFDLLAQH